MKLLKVSKNEDFLSIIMGILGMTYGEVSLASSSKIGKAFKLTKVSGAYGVVIPTMKCCKGFMVLVGALKELDDYLNRLEEAEKEITEN